VKHAVFFVVVTCLGFGIAHDIFSAENARAYGIVSQTLDSHIKGSNTEKVTLYSLKGHNSKDTIERDAILMWYPEAVATILICHGFMCDKFDVGFLRDLFPRGQYNIMTFDFRAHGQKRDGQYCTFGKNEAYDVIAAAQFIKTYPPLKGKPLIVYGFSMGAVAAIEAEASSVDHVDGTNGPLFAGMILDCPFDSAENVIKRALDNTKLSLFGYEFNVPGRGILQKYAFHPYVQSLVKVALKAVANLNTQDIKISIRPVFTAESAKKIYSPCFFIHCKNDEKVSVESIKRVYSNVGGYKKLWVTNGRRHFDSFFYNPERYVKKVRKFLLHVLNNCPEEKKNKIIYDDDMAGI
jgi:pimeloyl-ACP methyl ester carboxylesterase